MSNDDITSYAIELVSGQLRRVKPAVAHDLDGAVAGRLARGDDERDVHHWYLAQLVVELHACDGAAFGRVIDDDAVPPPHAGGRPRLMGDEERLRFFNFMASTDGTIQARIGTFVKLNLWCRWTEEQLEAQWRNRSRKKSQNR